MWIFQKKKFPQNDIYIYKKFTPIVIKEFYTLKNIPLEYFRGIKNFHISY